MALNKTQLDSLVAVNLADNSNILPSKHREVEQEIINYLYSKLPRLSGWFSNLDVGGMATGASLPHGGDIIFAVVVDSGQTGNSLIRVTMSTPMDNDNYKVNLSIQSMGTANIDNDIFSPVFKILSAQEFQISIAETGGPIQNLKFHFDAIQL